MSTLLRYLIYAHRYLGVALSLLFIVWFASGIVMIYVGDMPGLTAQQRLQRLPELQLRHVMLTPAQAAQRAGSEGVPTLTSVFDRPAYRFPARGGSGTTVFADTGELLQPTGIEQAHTVVSRFMDEPVDHVRHVGTLAAIDQWTLAQRRDLPLFKFEIDDAAGTQIYVSPQRAEIVQLTTRRTRALAWTGTIPHWLYFAALRANQTLWYKVVVWTSALGCVLAMMGLVLAFTQFRKSKPFRLLSSIPYRGWMRWHYIVGAVFGVFALTWVFSGLLSMEPFAWTNAEGLEIDGDALSGGPPDLAGFAVPDAGELGNLKSGSAIKEIEFTRIQDEQYYVVKSVASDSLLVNAATMAIRSEPFSVDSLLSRLRAAAPGVPMVDSQLLPEYDSYYYARNRQAPLPVLRVKFGDPAETWYYVDPQRSRILAQVHRYGRLERWLYNGLHSLDFSFWYGKRPWWDLGMLTLLLGGLALSCTGFYLGIKRLWRDLRRLRTSPGDAV
jgi:hypothetical protein